MKLTPKEIIDRIGNMGREKSTMLIKGHSILALSVGRDVLVQTANEEFHGVLLYRSPRVTWLQPFFRDLPMIVIPTPEIVEAWDMTGWVACA
jgi:hypothetical protein